MKNRIMNTLLVAGSLIPLIAQAQASGSHGGRWAIQDGAQVVADPFVVTPDLKHMKISPEWVEVFKDIQGTVADYGVSSQKYWNNVYDSSVVYAFVTRAEFAKLECADKMDTGGTPSEDYGCTAGGITYLIDDEFGEASQSIPNCDVVSPVTGQSNFCKNLNASTVSEASKKQARIDYAMLQRSLALIHERLHAFDPFIDKGSHFFIADFVSDIEILMTAKIEQKYGIYFPLSDSEYSKFKDTFYDRAKQLNFEIKSQCTLVKNGGGCVNQNGASASDDTFIGAGSIIDGYDSKVTSSTIINSRIVNSTVTGSTIVHSKLDSSTVTTKSTISESEITTSKINASSIANSYLRSASVSDSEVTNGRFTEGVTITHKAKITDCTLGGKVQIDAGSCKNSRIVFINRGIWAFYGNAEHEPGAGEIKLTPVTEFNAQNTSLDDVHIERWKSQFYTLPEVEQVTFNTVNATIKSLKVWIGDEAFYNDETDPVTFTLTGDLDFTPYINSKLTIAGNQSHHAGREVKMNFTYSNPKNFADHWSFSTVHNVNNWTDPDGTHW